MPGLRAPQPSFTSAPTQERRPAEPPTTQQPTTVSSPQAPAGTFGEMLEQLYALIAGARSMPLGSNVVIHNQREVLDLIEHAMNRLPEEIQQANWVLKERDEVLAKAQADAALLIDDARSKAAQLVQKTEVVRSAERRAGQLIDDAKTNARRQRLQIDDYCEQVLAQFEQAIAYVLNQVAGARSALAPEPLRPDELTKVEGTGAFHPDATQRHEAVARSDVPKAPQGMIYDQEKLEPRD